jgi:arsenate reductase
VKKIHWPLSDPAKAKGTEDEIMAQFRATRDEVKARVGALLDDLRDRRATGENAR